MKKRNLCKNKSVCSYEGTCSVCMRSISGQFSYSFFLLLFVCSSISNTYIPRRRFDVCPYWTKKKRVREREREKKKNLYVQSNNLLYISCKNDRSALLFIRESKGEEQKNKEEKKREDHRSVNVAFVIIMRDMLSSFFVSRCMCSLIKDIT
jgi:hypothetical protein